MKNTDDKISRKIQTGKAEDADDSRAAKPAVRSDITAQKREFFARKDNKPDASEGSSSFGKGVQTHSENSADKPAYSNNIFGSVNTADISEANAGKVNAEQSESAVNIVEKSNTVAGTNGAVSDELAARKREFYTDKPKHTNLSPSAEPISETAQITGAVEKSKPFARDIVSREIADRKPKTEPISSNNHSIVGGAHNVTPVSASNHARIADFTQAVQKKTAYVKSAKSVKRPMHSVPPKQIKCRLSVDKLKKLNLSKKKYVLADGKKSVSFDNIKRLRVLRAKSEKLSQRLPRLRERSFCRSARI